jgi:CheY-like chemotaxis protein
MKNFLRLHAADLLAEAGFEVVHAADADAALEIPTSRNDVRVLFTDVQMPGELDGMELAHEVRMRSGRTCSCSSLQASSDRLRPISPMIVTFSPNLTRPIKG